MLNHRPVKCALAVLAILNLLHSTPTSAAELDADLVRSATGQDRGVAVVMGVPFEFAADLANQGQMIVHLLVKSAPEADPIRHEVQEQNLGGRVVVDHWSWAGELPYPDRFVNLFVVDLDAIEKHQSLPTKIRDTLATRGAAYLRSNGQWEVLRAAKNELLDDWTHRFYDASGNCLSHDRVSAFPRMVQWQTGPAMEDGTADGKVPRIVDGRWVTVDTSSGDLICRDAGNGVLLWTAPLRLSLHDELAIADGRIYLYHDAQQQGTDDPRRRRPSGPLVAVDLNSGLIVQTFEQSIPAGTTDAIEFTETGEQTRLRRETPVPWFVVDNAVVVQAYADQLVVLDRRSGERRFTRKLTDATWFSPVIWGNVVLAAEVEWPARRGRHDGSGYARAVVAYAADSGKLLWRNENIHAERKIDDQDRSYFSRAEFKPMSVAAGQVLLHTSSYQFRQGGSIALHDLADGRELWRQSFEPKQRYTQGSQRAIIRGEEVVLLDGMGALRFDRQTGKPLGEAVTLPKESQRMARRNGACTASRATDDWLICNAYLYVGPDGKVNPHFGTRGACGQGVIPANGMIFVPPTPCDCGDYARGHVALAPTMAGRAIANEERLVIGNAYGKTRRSASEDDMPAWPTFLGDPQRRCATRVDLADRLEPAWQSSLVDLRHDAIDRDRRYSERYLGAISAPTIDQGLVVVAAPETHEVMAIDAQKGSLRWRFLTGGKVDSPPTLAEGLAVFGCDDGWVYALRTDDGELAWKFHTAPSTAVGLHHGHLASGFPLPGATLVLEDKVVAVAGHHTDLGGLHCWVLDLQTGRPECHRVVLDDQPRVVTNGITVADADGKGFWIGRQLHMSLQLEFLPVNWYEGPHPPVATDRNGTRMRFRTNTGRGGSTHGWKQAMVVPGRGHWLHGHRLAQSSEIVLGLNDPQHARQTSPVAWSVRKGQSDAEPIWQLSVNDLGEHESYGALLLAGERVYLGGGSRDGRTGFVQVIAVADGRLLQEIETPARVTECGLAAVGNHLFVSCEDGSLLCFE